MSSDATIPGASPPSSRNCPISSAWRTQRARYTAASTAGEIHVLGQVDVDSITWQASWPRSPRRPFAMSAISGIRILRWRHPPFAAGFLFLSLSRCWRKQAEKGCTESRKRRFPCCCFTRGGFLYISTSSYSLPPIPSFSAASTVWTPFLDSMRSSRWSLPGSSEAYTKSRQA